MHLEIEICVDDRRARVDEPDNGMRRVPRQLPGPRGFWAVRDREAVRRDVDRERYLRLDSAAEAEQCKARLAALQRDLARMEEALRCMLQYKTRCSQLKQDKATLAAAYEARIQQCQTTISKLSQENEALKKQVKSLEAQQQGGGAVQQALLERLRALEADNRLLSSDAEQQRRQYERCLDDVANQVVRALLSQKGLREEIGALQHRIRELETQNRALTALLVQQAHPGGPGPGPQLKQLTAGEVTAAAGPGGPAPAPAADMVTLSKPRLRRPAGRHRPPPTCGANHPADPAAAILAAVASIDPALWLQVSRPQSLHLVPPMEGAQESGAGRVALKEAEAIESATDVDSWKESVQQATTDVEVEIPAEVTDEVAEASVAAAVVTREDQDGSSSPESSPESGNRDEGYSTMSSDVQVEASSRLCEPTTASALHANGLGQELEEVEEEAEQGVLEAVADVVSGNPVSAGGGGGRLLLLDLQALSARHSFPPARDLQAALRNSFSDSHLCLSRLLHHAASFASTPASCPATDKVLLVDLGDATGTGVGAGKQHPLRRARATPSLLPPQLPPPQLGSEGEEDTDLAGDWWDADYVQHWLRLDETRSALQQRHREALDLELEYDQAELEDWSLSLSCEELDSPWRRATHTVDQPPSEAPPAPAPQSQLPSIQVQYCRIIFPNERRWSSKWQMLVGSETARTDADNQTYGTFQENNSLELEEDSSECLWNNASYMQAAGGAGPGGGCRGGQGGALTNGHAAAAGWPYALPALQALPLLDQTDAMISSLAVNAAGSSPGGSWSSSAAASDCYDCCLNGCHGEDGSSKRSSAALSGCSDESAATSAASRESPTIGTDFTRDFYRLVKFESTKSLASSSSSRHSRGQNSDHNNINNNLPASMDREQALQSVLKFIAEQQKYCHSREEQDSATELGSGGSRPVSYSFSVDDEHAGAGAAEPPESLDSMELRSEPRSLSNYSEGDAADAEGSGSDAVPVEARNEDADTAEVEVQVPDAHDLVELEMVASTAALDALAAPTAAPLPTVLEDEELDTSPCGRPAAVEAPVIPSVLVCDANDKAVSFHENATSKDVIDELNRMIRKGDSEESVAAAAAVAGAPAHPLPSQMASETTASSSTSANMDGAALSCPTGWVHVERDIDFTDPKARANLLDVMLASSGSGSSGSMSSSGSESGDAEDLPADYRHLHRLHRFRRHKKASAFREPFGVLRFPASSFRPSIIGRDDFFVRYGEKEREAISSFDFLDDMSTASISCASGASSTLGSLQKLDATAVADEEGDDGRGTPTPQDGDGVGGQAADDSDERSGGQLSLSDSCGNSLSGSRSSLDDHGREVESSVL
ncbi:Nck-associated protein 5 [Frankliniella fusca]|uniref:Nck-associated protein 5 n=1 Tax=Frankliniella fusca TaxID=407009 RepID=A0AAE1LHC9_9NEOP|nr:Nck-associated protein 5 [Frankliniella fusca]